VTAFLPSTEMAVSTPPLIRPRRRRRSEAIRGLVREYRLHTSQLIAPLFVSHGRRVRREVASMPGVFQLSLDALDATADELVESGIRSVILFGLPAAKDETGSENFDPDGIVPQALMRLRRRHPSLCLISDLCCCEYTDHGHCGCRNQPGTGWLLVEYRQQVGWFWEG